MRAVIFAVDSDTVQDQDRPLALVRLCGMSLLERNLLTLNAIGVKEVLIVTGNHASLLEETVRHGMDLGMRIDLIGSDPSPAPLSFDETFDGCLVIEDGYLVDGRILEALSENKRTAVAYDSHPQRNDDILHVALKEGRLQSLGANGREGAYAGASRCGDDALDELKRCIAGGNRWTDALNRLAAEQEVAGVDVEQLPRYVAEIRRDLKPYWFKIDEKRHIDRAKRALIDASQKRTLDVLAWYVHRPLESFLVSYTSELSVTPNQLSVLVNVIAYVVTLLFFTGHLLAGVLVAFAVNVLDGVDGKQARVKGLMTKLGHIEHSFDLLFEQSWYIAFAWAIFSAGGKVDLLPLELCILMIFFDSFARHVTMQFRQVMGISLADCAGFDRAFRRFDGRRNIYWIYMFLSVVWGTPFYALVVMTCHAFLTGFVYVVRAWQHLSAADRGEMGSENR